MPLLEFPAHAQPPHKGQNRPSGVAYPGLNFKNIYVQFFRFCRSLVSNGLRRYYSGYVSMAKKGLKCCTKYICTLTYLVKKDEGFLIWLCFHLLLLFQSKLSGTSALRVNSASSGLPILVQLLLAAAYASSCFYWCCQAHKQKQLQSLAKLPGTIS
jgi:hypothetical protein